MKMKTSQSLFHSFFTPGLKAVLPLALLLLAGGEANPQAAAGAGEMVALTDTTGTVVKFESFGVELKEATGDLRRRYLATIASIYGSYIYGQAGDEKAIPIRQSNGVFLFVTFDKVSEYHLTGETATIILVSGEQVVGSPLAECTFNGETALGELSVPARKTSALKFNPEKAKEYLEALYRSYSDWPAQYKSKADVTLVSGDHLPLQSLALMVETTYSYCDDNYIPCKPVSGTSWNLRELIPMKHGEFEGELEFSNTGSIEFSAPTKPTTGPIGLNVILLSGEKITAMLREPEGKKLVALLGITELGYAHVPLEQVKSVVFASSE